MKKILFIAIAVIFLAGCQGGSGDKASSGEGESVKSLTAAGATFPMPFYNLVFKNYKTCNS